MIAFDRAAVLKAAEENEENAIKLKCIFQQININLNSLHQVNIMLPELDLRMLLYFYRKLSVVRKNIKLFRDSCFKMGCVLYTGAHYTRVNTIIKI